MMWFWICLALITLLIILSCPDDDDDDDDNNDFEEGCRAAFIFKTMDDFL